MKMEYTVDVDVFNSYLKENMFLPFILYVFVLTFTTLDISSIFHRAFIWISQRMWPAENIDRYVHNVSPYVD